MTEAEFQNSISKGMSKISYEQIVPHRSVVGATFPNGVINMEFSCDNVGWWIPSRTYLRIRLNLFKTGTTSLLSSDGIAPAMNLVANLWDNIKLFVNGKVINEMTQYISQIDTINGRLTKSKEWLDNVGMSLNYWDANFNKRLNELAFDGMAEDKGISYGTEILGSVFDPLFKATTTIAYVSATGVLTFGTGDIGALPHFNPGDQIISKNALSLNRIYVVESMLSATTLKVQTGLGDVVAAADAFYVRQIHIAKQSKRRRYGLELIWNLPLGFFKIDKAIPTGTFRLQMTPAVGASTYKYRAVESLAAKVPVTNYDISVVNMYLYVCRVEGPSVPNGQRTYVYEEVNCSQETATTGQKRVEINPYTDALCVAYQHNNAGGSTLYSPSMMKSDSNVEQTITALQLRYAGQTKPDPKSDTVHTALVNNGTAYYDYLMQRYLDTHIYSGNIFKPGGPESYDDWLERGPIYFFQWPKGSKNQDTTVIVDQTFSGTMTNTSMLLLSYTKKYATINYKDGQSVGLVETDYVQ
jgi:hypothetical protein